MLRRRCVLLDAFVYIESLTAWLMVCVCVVEQRWSDGLPDCSCCTSSARPAAAASMVSLPLLHLKMLSLIDCHITRQAVPPPSGCPVMAMHRDDRAVYRAVVV
jgi:hypothetical protein